MTNSFSTKKEKANLQSKLIPSIIHSLDIIVPLLFPEYQDQVNIYSILESIPNSPSIDQLISQRMAEAQEALHFLSSAPDISFPELNLSHRDSSPITHGDALDFSDDFLFPSQ